MEKIYIYGDESSREWCSSIGELIPIPLISTSNDDAIHDFVVSSIDNSGSNCKIIIDLDANNDNALALTIALHIRLSLIELKSVSFAPILFVSCLPLQSFLSLGECSEFFLSQIGYGFCSPNDDILRHLNEVKRLSVSNYSSEFLDRIQIRPNAITGRHSMANQWGADVFNRIISKDALDIQSLAKAKKTLYYKYIYLNTKFVGDIIEENKDKVSGSNLKCNAVGKKVLLIDDEANKGWSDVLKKWLIGYSVFDVIDYPIKELQDMSSDICKKIYDNYYDLYLLDLRLLGNLEDDIYEANEFSGMKILKSIKGINPGNQVVVMTASNKAWNMKALLDAGVDGYYIKESPEQKLPWDFSFHNYSSFWRDVIKAFDSGYKKEVFIRFKSLIKAVRQSQNISEEFGQELVSIILATQNQILSAKEDKEFAYSFVSLYQIFELICKEYITGAPYNVWQIDGRMDLCSYNTENYVPIKKEAIIKEYPSTKSKIVAIYIEMCFGSDCKFIKRYIDLNIERRNAFVHNDVAKLADTNIAKIYEPCGFLDLLYAIDKILEGIL